MATETQTVNSKVEQVDINLDEIFNAAPSGADMIQDDKKQKNIFSGGSFKLILTIHRSYN